MRKYICAGEMIPRGYRTAWYEPWKRCEVCYPFGIHYLARIIYRIWTWSYLYIPGRFEKEKMEYERKLRNEIIPEYQKEIWELRDKCLEQEKTHQLDLKIINTLTELVQEYEQYVPKDKRPNPSANVPVKYETVEAGSIEWSNPPEESKQNAGL